MEIVIKAFGRFSEVVLFEDHLKSILIQTFNILGILQTWKINDILAITYLIQKHLTHGDIPLP